MNEMLEADLRETYAERDASYDPSEALGRIRARAGGMPIDRRRGLRPIWGSGPDRLAGASLRRSGHGSEPVLRSQGSSLSLRLWAYSRW